MKDKIDIILLWKALSKVCGTEKPMYPVARAGNESYAGLVHDNTGDADADTVDFEHAMASSADDHRVLEPLLCGC